MLKRIATSAALLLCIATGAKAQSDYKLGNINRREVLQTMPQYIDATEEINKTVTRCETEIKSMVNDFNAKFETYMAQRDTLPQSIIARREEELTRLDGEIKTFRQVVNEEVTRQQKNLLQPIEKRLNHAIQAVGDSYHFTYIFDTSAPLLPLPISWEESLDITDVVKRELGID